MNILPFTDVTNWEVNEDNPSYPYGARPKMLLVSSNKMQTSFIKNHFYLFKITVKWQPTQFWSETIAYHLGTLMGLDIPKAFPAKHSNFIGQEKYGVLIEWFLKKPKEENSFKLESLAHGGEFFKKIIKGYDSKRGIQHNFATVRQICDILIRLGELEEPWEKYWSEVLCFDSIIGNTDRHQDNWGFIIGMELENQVPSKLKFSPIFDNGTSLGYEILEKNYFKFNDDAYMLRYLNKGAHHMKYSKKNLDTFGGTQHFKMINKICKSFPKMKEHINSIIPGDEIISSLKEILLKYAQFKTIPEKYSLTEEKIQFTIKLINKRIELIKKAVNE